MDKTLHYKLTDKHQYTYPTFIDVPGIDEMSIDLHEERKIMREAAKDLLSPRPEAISRILEMSRML